MARSWTSTPTLCILLLAFVSGFANAARLLDSVPTAVPAAQTLSSGQIPALVPSTNGQDDDVASGDDGVVDDSGRVSAGQPGGGPDDATDLPEADPIGAATATAPASAGPVTASPAGSGVAAGATGAPAMSFFMHDILGGTRPTTRAVTGIIASAQINGIPFSKSNNQIFPINGATPLPTTFINNYRNTLPFLAGLNGAQNSAILQNNGNSAVSGGGNQPFVTAGNLPAGATLQQLMFGSVTVIDDELTEGHELGSGVMGRAQGFYLASSLDGTSHTFAFTALLGHAEHGAEDTISFFGVHRTASLVSQVAVIGGTGKYENARGYATIEPMHQLDQHITDGVDTVFQFHVYL
uniref:Dirigent protein n=1 Tax=Kalanchoe fedtschenkoi TaxID=63787 RepID=A0A7N0TLD4_KALFE